MWKRSSASAFPTARNSFRALASACSFAHPFALRIPVAGAYLERGPGGHDLRGGPWASCAGFYGFSVNNNGMYTVGPAPGGVAQIGQIAPSELALINQDATAVANGDLQSASCTAGGAGAPGTSDRIDMMFTDGPTVTVYDADGSAGRVCVLGDPASVLRLHTDLQLLLDRYYPVPFGPTPFRAQARVRSPAPPQAPAPGLLQASVRVQAQASFRASARRPEGCLGQSVSRCMSVQVAAMRAAIDPLRESVRLGATRVDSSCDCPSTGCTPSVCRPRTD